VIGLGDTTHVVGRFLRDMAQLNREQRNFRVFGPDETLSNGLDAVFEITRRQRDAASVPNDELFAPTGRVMEMLSEHQCENRLESSIASLNYLLASHVWRQDHNGFTHQDRGFVDHVVNKKAEIVRVYFPPDANCLLSVMDHCPSTTSP